MPRPRFERAAPEKREALLNAATKEFAAHGYDAASINRILLAAGFSKGSFYYYFDDKIDLAAAVLEREVQRYEPLWTALPTPANAAEFWELGTKLFERSTARLRAEPHTTDAMTRLGTAAARNPELSARLSKTVDRSMRKLATLWKRGQEVGAVRDDMSAEDLLLFLQDAKLSLVRILMPTDRAPTVAEIEAFARVHLDMVRRIAEKAR
jgi:AcrR family transcriptional regulator